MNKEKLTKKEISKYALLSLLILAGIIAISYCSYLSFYYLLAIFLISIAIIPLIIRAYIKQKDSFNSFEQLCNYLTNIIPIFLQKTKIRFTLGELYEICEGNIRNSIEEAIKYIDTTRDDPDLLSNGLKIIEDKFHNSRVKSVHKFLLSVESTNSQTYKEIADNLNKDIEQWIKRTYEFQKDLKNRRIKILFLCIATLLMNVLFVFVYTTNDIFNGFVNDSYYQISTFIFILLVLTIIAFVIFKLNGEWLIADYNRINDEKTKQKYRYYKQGKQKLKAIDIILAIIILAGSVYFFFIDNRITAYALFMIDILLITQKTRRYKNTKKYITKQLTMEFPMWLREVSLSLGNLTVLNAIENSISSSSYAFRREIKHFLTEVSKNPSSILPYNEFLDEYGIDDVKPSMRVLYAVNNVSKSEMKDRMAKLIDRNQDLLAKSETIRNYDSIGGIETIGYLPTIVFSVHMMISMIVMLNFMLSALGGYY